MERASGSGGAITEMPTFVTTGVSKEEEKERRVEGILEQTLN